MRTSTPTYIPPSDNGKRLDNVVARFARHAPRDYLYKAIRSGQVRIDGKRVKPHQRVYSGQTLRLPPQLHIARTNHTNRMIALSNHTKQDIEKRILLLTEQLLVINKPSGIAVHAGGKQRYGIIELLRAYFDSPRYPELVHRIDKLTSGCLVLAQNAQSLLELQQLWRQRKVHKVYIALVHGDIKQSTKQTTHPIQRTIALPLYAKEEHGRKRVLVDHTVGAQAITHIQKIANIQLHHIQCSLIQCIPHTGRMHQIRVHCQSIGHAIVGDPIYQNKYQHQWSMQHFPNTMFLHAQKIEFDYLNENINIQSPDPSWLLNL